MKKIIIVVSCLVLGLSTFAYAQEQSEQDKQEAPPQATLKIVIDNFKNDKGGVLAMLFRPDDELYKPESAFKKMNTTIVEGTTTVVFENLPFGKYAAVIVHDENNNGKMDHRWYGAPKEGFGLSNNRKRSLFSGRPKFKDLAFTVSNEHTTVTIQMQSH